LLGLLLLLGLGGLVLGSWGAWRYLVTTPRFGLAALEVEGLRLLRGEDVLRASGLQLGDNIFAVDLEEVVRRLEEECWIREALVGRKPPDRLMIHLVERQRLAWIDLGQTYGIDGEGVLLPGERLPGESHQDLDLPVISGLRRRVDSPRPGQAVADSSLALILDWWQEARVADGEFCMNVSEIQPLADQGIRLRLVGDGLEVRLPLDRVPFRIRTLKRWLERVYGESPAPAYIDLRYAGQVVVGSRQGSS
jgi:cell division protein FtsQ